jgi:phenylalanyl-tRNA synthetase beta chain
MDILIPDEWLRNFLDTKATPKVIAEKLSLCGPSVDRVSKKSGEPIYEIEVTTNRVDSASVYGIAREAHAILPRFGIKTGFAEVSPKIKQNFVKKVDYLDASVNTKLCPRFAAVLVRNIKLADSPDWVKERLEWVGVRPINNVVDISNYVMHELGQPVHTFDYDKIKDAKMKLRASKKGEKLTTLDSQDISLPGGDIVIEDGKGRLIDLAGIMGGANSAVDAETKNVLLFVQTYDAVTVRKTSMSIPKRTEAVELFEKGLDSELVTIGISRAIELFEKLTGGEVEKNILDIYPKPYKAKKLSTELSFIEKRLGITIAKDEITRLLKALGFNTKWTNDNLTVTIPSFRADDVSIPEDILEEIARIYGYHNLPSHIMTGRIPEKPSDSPFEFELMLKRILKGFGAYEIYTLSLVSEEEIDETALELKNPLGEESKILRNNLRSSVVSAAKTNTGIKVPFHLFEMSNTYLPKKGKLPVEEMNLAGIFSGYSYRETKGVIEALLAELNVDVSFVPEDAKYFHPSKRVIIKVNNMKIGIFGVLDENGLIYYEFGVEKLRTFYKPYKPFVALPKYPPQIEDITLSFPEKTKVGDVIRSIKSVHNVSEVELVDIYKDAYTFRVHYQDPKKTLDDKEVKAIRNKFIKKLNKQGIIQK